VLAEGLLTISTAAARNTPPDSFFQKPGIYAKNQTTKRSLEKSFMPARGTRIDEKDSHNWAGLGVLVIS